MTSRHCALWVALGAIIGLAGCATAGSSVVRGDRNVPPVTAPATILSAPSAAAVPPPEVTSALGWQAALAERSDLQAVRQTDRLAYGQDVISFGADAVDSWSEGASVSIALVSIGNRNRPIGDRMVSVNGAQVGPSASLAKAYWVVAAAEQAIAATVDEQDEVDSLGRMHDAAANVFRWSSNDAASALIRAAGVDAINSFTNRLGMEATFLRQWRSGQRSSEPNPIGDGNTTSVADAVRFLDAIAGEGMIDDVVAAQTRVWMKETPDNLDDVEFHGVMGHRLPSAVSRELMHKAGWLPPNCCDHDGSTLLAMSLFLTDDLTDDIAEEVDADTNADTNGDTTGDTAEAYRLPPDAESYALAVAVNGGANYERQQAYIAWVACLAFQAMADPSHPCGDAVAQ